jgi:hypothetical protein
MSVVVKDDVIRLEGRCRVEDAETLHAALQRHPRHGVDLRDCTSLHTALVQLLLIAAPPVRQPPQDVMLARWLVPLLETGGDPFEPGPVSL